MLRRRGPGPLHEDHYGERAWPGILGLCPGTIPLCPKVAPGMVEDPTYGLVLVCFSGVYYYDGQD